jgi:hypothetical protein
MLLMLSLMTASWALAEKQQDMENYPSDLPHREKPARRFRQSIPGDI